MNLIGMDHFHYRKRDDVAAVELPIDTEASIRVIVFDHPVVLKPPLGVARHGEIVRERETVALFDEHEQPAREVRLKEVADRCIEFPVIDIDSQRLLDEHATGCPLEVEVVEVWLKTNLVPTSSLFSRCPIAALAKNV